MSIMRSAARLPTYFQLDVGTLPKHLARWVSLALFCVASGAHAESKSIALPGDRAYPESVTSTADGTLYVGNFAEGGVLRIAAGAAPESWIKPGAYGTRSVLGVLADERSRMLWLCSNDLSGMGVAGPGSQTGAYLKGFDLKTGEGKVSAAFPGAQSLCNDIAVDAEGGVYVTNTIAPEILKLSRDRKTLEVWKRDPQLAPPADGSGGLDGLAFGSDGHLYVNTFGGGELFRVDVQAGKAGKVVKLKTSRPLKLPDCIRAAGPNSFLMIEGDGHLDRVTVKGDSAVIETIGSGFDAPTAVTQIGQLAWVSAGQLPHLLDPVLKKEKPEMPFRLYAVPLSTR